MKSIVIAFTIFCSTSVFAQLPFEQVDYAKFIKNISYTNADGKSISVAYYIPEMYWNFAKESMHFTDSDIDTLKAWLNGYTPVILCHGTVNPETGFYYFDSEEKMAKEVKIVYQGKTYLPLERATMPEEVENIYYIIKPAFSEILGQLGSGLNMYFFDIRDKDQQTLIDPYKSPGMQICVGPQVFNFSLPLPCLYPDKTCPADKETFPSNYNYCPIHGNKLN